MGQNAGQSDAEAGALRRRAVAKLAQTRRAECCCAGPKTHSHFGKRNNHELAVARAVLVRLRWALPLCTDRVAGLCIQVADTRHRVGRRRQSVGLLKQQRAALVTALPVNLTGSNYNGGHLDVPVRAALIVQSCRGMRQPVPTVSPVAFDACAGSSAPCP
jgi:hypothetical protein